MCLFGAAATPLLEVEAGVGRLERNIGGAGTVIADRAVIEDAVDVAAGETGLAETVVVDDAASLAAEGDHLGRHGVDGVLLREEQPAGC